MNKIKTNLILLSILPLFAFSSLNAEFTQALAAKVVGEVFATGASGETRQILVSSRVSRICASSVEKSRGSICRRYKRSVKRFLR